MVSGMLQLNLADGFTRDELVPLIRNVLMANDRKVHEVDIPFDNRAIQETQTTFIN